MIQLKMTKFYKEVRYMNNYKLIVTDMDGTVLGGDHKITDENIRALKEAEDKGIKVVFATGRFHDSAKEHVNFLDKIMPIISSNGAIIKHPITNEVLYSNSIDTNTCLKIIDILDSLDIVYQIYTDNEILQKYKTEEEREMMLEFISKNFSDKTEIIFKKNLREDIKGLNVLKFNLMEIDKPLLIKEARKQIEDIDALEVTSSWKNNLEIMKEGSSKGEAVKYLSHLLGIDREDIITFGDNYNDLSMIEYAGTGVAMGNAEEDVKKVASYVTDLNTESGVAKAIDNLVLQKVISV